MNLVIYVCEERNDWSHGIVDCWADTIRLYQGGVGGVGIEHLVWRNSLIPTLLELPLPSDNTK